MNIQPPPGYVLVSFIEPYSGSTLVSESDLTLVERGLAVGDVVKRRSQDAESGTVIRTSVDCTLQPIYTGVPSSDASTWPYKEEDNWLFQIPGGELQYIEDYHDGDYVVYQGWVGVVRDVFEEVTIRLSNGSVVVVEHEHELEVPIATASSKKKLRNMSLASALERLRTARESGSETEPAEEFYPGLVVTTKKGNLRRGKWSYGAYDPSVSPVGIVVEVRGVQLEVEWMTCNVFDVTKRHKPMPSALLNLDDLESGGIQLYDKGRMPRGMIYSKSFGATRGSSFGAGDYVKFRDVAGAALKYSGSPATNGLRHGTFHRIPRTSTQGYDMNIFSIKEAKLKTVIQWQDGSRSEEDSVSLVPYLNVDDHDVWPGEIVALKSNDLAENLSPGDALVSVANGSDFLKPKRIGVVQSTDARERLARVRWFVNPEVGIFDEQKSVLLPGSSLGQLYSEITEVSFYEIIAYPALTKRRADLVLVAPNPQTAALHSTQALQEASSNSAIVPATLQAMFGSVTGPIRSNNLDVTSNDTIEDFSHTDSQGIDWFGEIVDLGLDGLLTVRLGFLSEVKDIKVSIEQIIVMVGGDDESDAELSLSEDDDPEAWEDSISSESNTESESEDVLEEVVEYEGGQRIDADDDEDMWMTDEEDSNPFPVLASGDLPQTQEVETISPIPANHEPKEASYSQYNNMEAQFVVLDMPPPYDHHFLTKKVNLSAKLMRRVRYEHEILKASLPDGIWVRTWADRLDLLRVLIVGPRGTPYQFAPFVIDFHFFGGFPGSPPEAYFHSWTNGVGRINPNLYEDGKICLSLLGTWPGDAKNEGWSAERSSMLQVLVSLMALVLVEEPYYSEYLNAFLPLIMMT